MHFDTAHLGLQESTKHKALRFKAIKAHKGTLPSLNIDNDKVVCQL